MKQGKYRHYKGGEYEVIALAHHTETREDVVVYRALYPVTDLGEEFAKDPVFVRPRHIFEQQVRVDGQVIPRFRFVGEV